MASYKILLNNNSLPYSCFSGGADVCPNIRLNYDLWPQEVIVENIDNVEAWQAFMAIIFEQCLGTTNHGITYEQVN